MIQVYHIIPISYQEYLITNGFGRFVMAMAHLACSSTRYVSQIHAARTRGGCIILDNGTPYFGQSVPDDLLAEAANLVKPDVLVLPDVLNDRNATETRIDSFLTLYSRDIRARFMGVIQGRSFREYVDSYQSIASDSRISYIGLPFMSASLHGDTGGFERERLLETLLYRRLIVSSKPHHMLGLSHSGNIELHRTRRFPFVHSCDTSAAYENAVLGRKISMNCEYQKPDAAIDFDSPFDTRTAEITLQNATCLNNCAR